MSESVPSRALAWLWPPAPAVDRTPTDPAQRAAVDAARLARELADEALARGASLDGPSPEVSSRVVARSLWREAVWQSLRARGPASRDLDALSGTDADTATVRAAMTAPDECHVDDLDAHNDALRGAVDALLGPGVTVTSSSRWATRLTRTGLALAALAGVVVMAPRAMVRMRSDVAPTSAWRASSTQNGYPTQGVGFHPREGEANIFFQTGVEPAPWIEFDLGAARAVAMVSVQNRLDCCQDWAVPLAVELSTDRARWVEVARRVEPFYFWDATFPRASARYVRLRVPRATSLHLGRVAIR